MILENTTRTFDSSQTIAQIGKFTLMACGAREFVCKPDENNNGFLRFRVNKTINQQFIIITLMPNDLYKVELVKYNRKYEKILLESAEDVYCDDLRDIIYNMVNK